MTQCDRTCKNCQYFEFDILEDSYGPYSELYCEKGNYGHVGLYSEPCKDFKDNLERD